MKNIAVIFCVGLLVLGFNQCKSPVGPDEKPGTRDYTWSVDTITIPFGNLSRLSGTGPEDVWAIGPGGSLKYTIYHYDGSRWATGGQVHSISPWCVHSVSRNSVWLAGQDGDIWRYDGQRWAKNYTFTKPNREVTFLDIWGNSDDNIYAIGHADSSNVRVPVIIKYNGHSWNEIKTPSYNTYAFMRIKKNDQSGNYYIMGWGEKSNGRDLFGIFELAGDQINQVYEGEIMPGIIQVQNQVLFSFNNKICSFSNNDFVTLTENNDLNSWWLLSCARNLKDIFLWVADGIAHYNGEDIKYIYKTVGTMSITDGILFNNDVFFISSDPSIGQTYIIRGKKNK